jgi:glycosyltransferase involved in cell wall biosynthesis
MPRPWPVLLLSRELGLGGSERQLAEIARSLDWTRFEPHVGCFHPEGIRGDQLRRAGVPVVRFGVTSFRSVSALAGALELGRYLEHRRIELVHSFDAPMNLFAAPVARLFRAPVVVTSQRAHRGLTPGLTRHLLRLTDQIADAIVVNCEAIRSHMVEDEKAPKRRIRLCYNGIDTGQFHPQLREARPGGEVVIGVVCALRPEKGLPMLLEAFRRVRETHDRVKLLIAGDGPLKPRLEAMSGELGIREACVFEPATDRVADRLRLIDIFVLPSISEALSNSLMEAMACGCAAVASRVGGNLELVRHGETGLLFDCADGRQLAACLRELLDHPELRLRMAEAGSRYIRRDFSLRAAVERMSEIYEELIAERT